MTGTESKLWRKELEGRGGGEGGGGSVEVKVKGETLPQDECRPTRSSLREEGSRGFTRQRLQMTCG